MKRFFLSTLLASVVLSLSAASVSLSEAQRIAQEFWANKVGDVTRSGGLSLVLTEQKLAETRATEAALYVFANEGPGYVIVSADDRTPAVLGYSTNTVFDANNMPENLKYWLGEYVSQISASTTKQIFRRQKAERTLIAPLISAHWDQAEPYNAQCPVLPNGQAVTGCVATALAQIMNLWKFPDVLPAAGGYIMEGGVKIDAITSHAIDWSAIKDSYSQTDKDDNIAWLMRHCGQEVQMAYSSEESAAITALQAAALMRFGYDNSVNHILRDMYKADTWESIIYDELADGRAVLYSGQSSDGGHAFVCDGYDADGFFHINWGWSGYFDGYFQLTALDPVGQGIGGSSSADGFNFDQEIVIGVAHGQNGPMAKRYMSALSADIEGNVITIGIYNMSGYEGEFNVGICSVKEDISINQVLSKWKLGNVPFLSGVIFTLDFAEELAGQPDGVYRFGMVSKITGTDDYIYSMPEGVAIVVTKNGDNVSYSFTGIEDEEPRFENITFKNDKFIYGSSLTFSAEMTNGNALPYTGTLEVSVYRGDLHKNNMAYLGTAQLKFTDAEPLPVGEIVTIELNMPEVETDSEFSVALKYSVSSTEMSKPYTVGAQVCRINLDENGLAAYSRSDALDFGKNTEMKFKDVAPLTASTVVVLDNNTVDLTEVKAAPANTGLVLQGEPNTVYAVAVTDCDDTLTNDLVPVTENTTIESFSVYLLATESGKPGFKIYGGTALQAGTACLPMTVVAKTCGTENLDWLPFFDGTNDISAPIIETVGDDAIRYNLNGQKVDKNYKGLVVSAKGLVLQR